MNVWIRDVGFCVVRESPQVSVGFHHTRHHGRTRMVFNGQRRILVGYLPFGANPGNLAVDNYHGAVVQDPAPPTCEDPGRSKYTAHLGRPGPV